MGANATEWQSPLHEILESLAAPAGLTPGHWQELQDSAISAAVAALNFRSFGPGCRISSDQERQSLKQKGGKEQHEQGPGQLGPKHGPEGRQERPKPGDHPRRRPLLQRRFQLQRVAREVLLKGRIG